MGILRAAATATGSVLGDQWKEFFYCESLDENILVAKGEKRSSSRSSNRKGSENIITDGSLLAVNDGQCAVIVDQGKIADICSEPGEYTYDSGTEPTLFCGNLGEGIKKSFAVLGKRFTFGGDTAHDQRIYYFNLKEITGNKYGTANPVPFRVIDRNIGLDLDITVRCNGEFSYKIVDPILFYTNVCGNVEDVYDRERIDSMLKTELLTALQPAFAKISAMGVRYSEIPAHTVELSDALNEALSEKWGELRGLRVASIGMNSINTSAENEKMIADMQRSAIMRDPAMAAAVLTGAQAEAMKTAAANEAGAMHGFIGMGMPNMMTGSPNTSELYRMAAEKQPEPADRWTCSCGAENDGKFCTNCGKPRPASAEWTCSCGAKNSGKFCGSCGKPRPMSDSWVCSCGTENTGNFCTNCGKPKNA